MKEIPMLFSTPMVQAIIEGRKTQTRRILKPQPSDSWMEGTKKLSPDGNMFDSKGKQLFWISDGKEILSGYNAPDGEIKSKAKPGDILYVRETWNIFLNIGDCSIGCENGCKHGQFAFLATGDWDSETKWKPSIHMPKEAARIWLRVTGVRVERLNLISEADAVAEGIQPLMSSRMQYQQWGQLYRHYTEQEDGIFGTGLKPVKSYETLWESINGAGSWAVNPWVWVYTFEVLSTTGKPENV